MDEDGAVRIASMVKVTMLAGIREGLKRGEDIKKILDRYEYSTFAMDADGALIIVTKNRRK